VQWYHYESTYSTHHMSESVEAYKWRTGKFVEVFYEKQAAKFKIVPRVVLCHKAKQQIYVSSYITQYAIYSFNKFSRSPCEFVNFIVALSYLSLFYIDAICFLYCSVPSSVTKLRKAFYSEEENFCLGEDDCYIMFSIRANSSEAKFFY
jgi:hypothetical protein